VNDFLRNFIYAGLFIGALIAWAWLIFAYLAALFG
jgi:hypothetical protein